MIQIAVRIIGQQRPPGFRHSATDNPIVAALEETELRVHGRSLCLQLTKSRACTDGLQLRFKMIVDDSEVDSTWNSDGNCGLRRQQLLRPLRAHERRNPRAEDLRERVSAHCKSLSAAQQVFRLPKFGLVTRIRELDGWILSRDRDPRIDALHKLFD